MHSPYKGVSKEYYLVTATEATRSPEIPWGRVITGKVIPMTPLGGMPRYISMASGLYLLYKTL